MKYNSLARSNNSKIKKSILDYTAFIDFLVF